MKKVIFTTKSYQTFQEMIEREKFIGFISKIESCSGRRFAILTRGEFQGLAVDGQNMWTYLEKQPFEEGNYFSFQSRKDLLLWMAGDTNVDFSMIPLLDNFSPSTHSFVRDFSELIQYYKFIGFIPRNYHGDRPKFFILVEGSYKGIAIKADLTNTWVKKEKQKDAEGDYFIFETREDLIAWLGICRKE